MIDQKNDEFWLNVIANLERKFPAGSKYRPIYPWENLKEFYISLGAQLRWIYCHGCQEKYAKIDWKQWFVPTKENIMTTPQKECYCEIVVREIQK